MSEIVSWIMANYIELITSVAIAVIGISVGKGISTTIKKRMYHDYSVQTAKLAGKAIYYVISAIAVIIAIGNLGVNLGSALVAGGFLGIVVGFAAQSSVSNLVSGIFLIADKPFKIGDYISYDNMSVQIVDINFFSTKAATWDGMRIRIPNNLLFNSNLINYTQSVVRLVRAQFNLLYEEDLNKVIPKIISEFKKQWFVLIDPEPQVFATDFSDKGVTVEVRVWTASNTWGDLYFSMVGTIVDTLKGIDIRFAYPKMMVENDANALLGSSK